MEACEIKWDYLRKRKRNKRNREKQIGSGGRGEKEVEEECKRGQWEEDNEMKAVRTGLSAN